MTVLIYGSYGYTGRLIVDEAMRRGLRPILGGRDAAAVRAQADQLRLEHRAFPLTEPRAVDAALDSVSAVMHCAGPFSRTSAPMIDACIRRGAHYLDITGEIAVFEAAAARDADARTAGVMLLPGVGFDVVPSDCLAAHLARRLPSATRLALAFDARGGLSRGTARTMLESSSSGGMVRRSGALERVPAAWRTRRIDFGDGRPLDATTIPWGDVSTAFYSTGIGTIEVYSATPPMARRVMIASRHLGWLLRSAPVRGLLGALIRRAPPGPSDEIRARTNSRLWGEVMDRRGRRAISRIIAPQSYALTALTAVAAVVKVLGGAATPGFRTPSLAFGPDFILEIPGVRREDVE
jgi:short subunit dehydrogenase-like uncharacterized protein